MPQPRKTDRPKVITATIPTSVYTQVWALLADPLAGGRIKYGELNKLLTTLLVEWLEKQRTQHSFPTDDPAPPVATGNVTPLKRSPQ